MILGIVRHGQTDFNKELKIQGKMDNKLNDTGRNQALTTANYLLESDHKWDFIYSSPLSRASETANIIGEVLNTKISGYLDDFIERDFGPFEGEYIKDVYPHIVSDDFRKEGYEHNEILIDRISSAALNLAKKHPNDKVLLIAHAHVVKSLCIFSDSNKYDYIENYTPNSSIAYFEISDDKIKLLSIVTF